MLAERAESVCQWKYGIFCSGKHYKQTLDIVFIGKSADFCTDDFSGQKTDFPPAPFFARRAVGGGRRLPKPAPGLSSTVVSVEPVRVWARAHNFWPLRWSGSWVCHS